MPLDNSGPSLEDINRAREAAMANPSIRKSVGPQEGPTESQSWLSKMFGFSRPSTPTKNTTVPQTQQPVKTIFEERGGAYKSILRDEVIHATGKSPYGRWATITDPGIKGSIDSIEQNLYGNDSYVSGDQLNRKLEQMEREIYYKSPNDKMAFDIIKKDLKDNNLIK